MIAIPFLTKPSTLATATVLDAKILDQQSKLPALRADHAALALAVADGQDVPATDLARALSAVREAEDIIANLQAARTLAHERENAAAREEAQLNRRKIINSCELLLRRRALAAQAFSEAIETAAKAYRELANRSRRAAMGFPPNEVPPGSELTGPAISRLAAFEIYRLGAVPGALGLPSELSLPAPLCPGLQFQQQPARITPLAETITQANEFALAKLREAKPEIPAAMKRKFA
jgi:hypothetical protein